MKIEKNNLNALSIDKLVINTRSKTLQTLFLNGPLTLNAFIWYANYYFTADNKGEADIFIA